jgi:CRISPR-associated protein Csb1
MTTAYKSVTNIESLLAADGPACLIIKAQFEPLGEQDRFQPAGFPEMGHVIYDAPRSDENGNATSPEKVCIVDSAASMANHLESVCFQNAATGILHSDLDGLPYVRCMSDLPKASAKAGETKRGMVVSSLTEGHRLASDYFLDGTLDKMNFREKLRADFGIIEIKKDKTYFVTPENWWSIYRTVFKFDPNSLVHGILFAKEQIKISRVLTAHLEAFGAGRVGSAGVKFDRLGKTTSGQPIFSKDEETAQRIEATFLIDLGLARSYGHGNEGLGAKQKVLLINFALWKIERMLATPFRFRSGCHLKCIKQSVSAESEAWTIDGGALKSDIKKAIEDCTFGENPITDVDYAAAELFSVKGDPDGNDAPENAEPEEEAEA